MKTKNTSPIFHSYIPKSLAKVLLFVLLLPNMLLFFLPIANIDVASGYFGIEPNEVQFMISLYYIGFVAFYSLERRFYSYFTYKRYFLIFQLVQILCCVILFSTSNLLLLYAVRFFQGMLFASAVNLYLSMISLKLKTFRAKEVSYSLFFGMLLCTSSVNNLVTADLIDHFNFDFLFQCMVLLYALNLMIVLITMKLNIDIKSIPLFQLDVSSFIYFSIFLIGLGYCGIFGQQYYWLQSRTIAITTIISFTALLLFIFRQFLLKRPYIDLKIFFFRKYLFGIVILFLMYICRFSFSYSGQFFKNVLGMDPKHVSYMYALNLIGIIIGVSYSCWHLITKKNIFVLWVTGFITLFMYHFIMNKQMFYYGNEINYFVPMSLHGIGIGLIMVPTILYCISSVTYYLAPSAAAFCLFIRFLGYTASGILVNYYTIYNTSIHKDRFMNSIQISNPIYQERFGLIKQKLLQNGFNQSTINVTSTTVLNKDIKKHLLLRSVMDYYTMMMYVSITVLILLLLYWLYQKRIDIKIRSILPI